MYSNSIKPTKPSHKRCFLLLAGILILYLIENYSPGFIKSDVKFTYILKPMLWIILILIVLRLPKLRAYGKIRFNDMLQWAAVLLASVYIGVMMICGILVGFGRSPFDHSIKGILINCILIFPPIIGREIIRSYLIRSSKKKNYFLSFAIIAVLFTLLSLSPDVFLKLNTKLDILKLFGETLLPQLCISIFACYLVYIGSPLLSIIYIGMQQAFYWFSPVLPNINWIATALIGTLCPLFSLMYLKYLYSVKAKEIKEINIKKENPLGWAATASFVILLFWFVIGVFPIRPYVIATGSMEPKIHPGDMVLVKNTEPEKLQIGDIIQYKREDIFIFHRVIAVVKENNETKYKTKGDNNSGPDSELVQCKFIKGKVVRIIPKVGWPTLLFRRNKSVDMKKIEF